MLLNRAASSSVRAPGCASPAVRAFGFGEVLSNDPSPGPRCPAPTSISSSPWTSRKPAASAWDTRSFSVKFIIGSSDRRIHPILRSPNLGHQVAYGPSVEPPELIRRRGEVVVDGLEDRQATAGRSTRWNSRNATPCRDVDQNGPKRDHIDGSILDGPRSSAPVSTNDMRSATPSSSAASRAWARRSEDTSDITTARQRQHGRVRRRQSVRRRLRHRAGVSGHDPRTVEHLLADRDEVLERLLVLLGITAVASAQQPRRPLVEIFDTRHTRTVLRT